MRVFNLAALQSAHVRMSLRSSFPRQPDKAFAVLTVAVDVAFEGLQVNGLVAVGEASPVAVVCSNRVHEVWSICFSSKSCSILDC